MFICGLFSELITPSSWRVGQQLVKDALPAMSDSPPTRDRPSRGMHYIIHSYLRG